MQNTDKSSGLLQAFTAHPAEAGESYGAHLWFTLKMAGHLVACAVLLVIHGLFPFLCTHSASKRMQHCQSVLTGRQDKTSCK